MKLVCMANGCLSLPAARWLLACPASRQRKKITLQHTSSRRRLHVTFFHEVQKGCDYRTNKSNNLADNSICPNTPPWCHWPPPQPTNEGGVPEPSFSPSSCPFSNIIGNKTRKANESSKLCDPLDAVNEDDELR